VPHYLPNENPFLKDIRLRYGIPEGQPTGGADSMYPEYKKKLGPSNWTAGDKKGATGADGVAGVNP